MSQSRSEPRTPVSIQGRYRTGSGMAKDVVVTDMSTMGCKFYDRFSCLKEGTWITIRIGNIGPLDATVRWRTGQVIGVQFESPLHPSILDHMVTTISGWTVPDLAAAPTEDTDNVEGPTALDVISVIIRQPNKTDFRKAIKELGLSFPLVDEGDLEAIFHHVLNGIFVRKSDA